MNLTELVMAAQSKITNGCPYLWKCFGDNARYIDFGVSEEKIIASAVVDATTQQVYCVEIFNLDNTQAWRWIDNRYQKLFLKECRERKFNPDICWDTVKYQHIQDNEALLLINQLMNIGGTE